jgi:hypothetical protein
MEKLTFCSDCRLNPEAKPPYAKMKRIRFTDLTTRLLEKAAKKENMKPECFVCEALLRIVKPEGDKDADKNQVENEADLPNDSEEISRVGLRKH